MSKIKEVAFANENLEILSLDLKKENFKKKNYSNS